ncbi:MAG: MobA/MobL family protein [Rhodomicrobium sp.]
MALMHFQHKKIGKRTHGPRAATMAINYITRFEKPDREAAAEAVSYNARDSAASVILAGRMPSEKNEAARWLEARAAEDRIDARICDTFIMALPRELTREQHQELVRDWCETVTQGKAAYFAAIHDKRKDADNPHAHILLRDRDYSLGDVAEKKRPRVIGTTTSKKEIEEAEKRGWRVPPRATTWDLRVSWADATNRALERAGLSVRLDPRSLKDQGIDREPQIHEGPQGKAARAKGYEPQSQTREKGARVIPYPAIDQGTRSDYNARIKAANSNERRSDPEFLQKEALREEQKVKRAELYAGQRTERKALSEQHTAEWAEHKKFGQKLYANARDEAYRETGELYASRWKEINQIGNAQTREAAAEALKAEQQATYKSLSQERLAEARVLKNDSYQELKERLRTEREALSKRLREEAKAAIHAQAAERQRLHQRWDLVREQKAAALESAQLTTSQHMHHVQTRALRKIGRDGQANAGRASPSQAAPSPLEKAIAKIAEVQEHLKDGTDRTQHLETPQKTRGDRER